MVMGLLREAKESGSSTVRMDPGAPTYGILGRIFVRAAGGVDEAIEKLDDVAPNLDALHSECKDFVKNNSDEGEELLGSVARSVLALRVSSGLRNAAAAGEEGEPAQSEKPAETSSSESPAAPGEGSAPGLPSDL